MRNDFGSHPEVCDDFQILLWLSKAGRDQPLPSGGGVRPCGAARLAELAALLVSHRTYRRLRSRVPSNRFRSVSLACEMFESFRPALVVGGSQPCSRFATRQASLDSAIRNHKSEDGTEEEVKPEIVPLLRSAAAAAAVVPTVMYRRGVCKSGNPKGRRGRGRVRCM